ncbi:ABC transporter ATP-binding protein [Streptomyces sp. NPDC005012]|uniref:ABC transporter ATP-binding protein n=1 Tax=Streptomyces sp. NPDC005012 TaxID=3154558 RepID=UPI0033A81510
MIKAIGLTSAPRKELPPVVDDVSFEALPGRVTALLGAPGAGRTTVLQLMLGLRPGRGVTHFRGRPLHESPAPLREVGVLLGDVPGHPARTVRGHLRMLCAAAGTPAARADELLECTGLTEWRDRRLDALSRGADRRLGMACALLATPHALVLDEPAAGLAPGDLRWLHTTLRRYADHGGAVLFTTADPKEAARIADQVVTLERGRVVADQSAGEFAAARLRRRVAVRTPHAERLADLLAKEGRIARRPVEVVREGGALLSVYGSTCAEVGEAAYRHRIPVHQLAEETGDMGAGAGAGAGADAVPGSRPTGRSTPAAHDHADPYALDALGASHAPEAREASDTPGPRDAWELSEYRPAPRKGAGADRPSVPPIRVRRPFSPLRPLRYEVRRTLGTGVLPRTWAAVVLLSALLTLLLSQIGHTPHARLLAAWPAQLPLPPAALGAALIGALSSGQEFRHPALAVDRGTVPRRLGLLVAKLLVSALAAVVPALAAVTVDAGLLRLLLGDEYAAPPPQWPALAVAWLALVTACAWAGVLAAGLFRSVAGGLAAVLAVPVVAAPLAGRAAALLAPAAGPRGSHLAGGALVERWARDRGEVAAEVLRLLGQPVGLAMTLALAVLVGAYAMAALRSAVR